MRVVLVIILSVFNIAQSDANISLNYKHNYSETIECVKTIIKQHFELSVITCVNFNATDMDILRHIHSMSTVTVINRKPFKKILHPNRGYLIFARSVEDFMAKFRYLLAEHTWMPYAPFVIVVQFLDVHKLVDIFEELLRVHVKNVVVVDGHTVTTYTYDPYENGGCGRRFDRIINLGKCLSDSSPDLYTGKKKNLLQNCTINMATTHYPPYSIDPKVSHINTTGIDEYLFSLLGEVWHFKVNISYFHNIVEEVSLVNDDMIATGTLGLLQRNRFDVVSGAIVLIVNRATAFTFLYGHIAYDDDFRVIVPRAPTVPIWKTMILEFSPSVWLLLFFTFGVVATLIILISKATDKAFVIINLWDVLLQHTCRIRRTPKIAIILIFWYMFASLVTYHYLTSLIGLSAKPIYTYQIQTIDDLKKFRMQPCISDAVQDFQSVVTLDVLVNDSTQQLPQCKKLGDSLETVSKTPNMYTILPYSQYYSSRYRYYDKDGEKTVYSFGEPLSKIIYANFLFKGFPMYDDFHSATLWIRSSGLINKVWSDYEYQQKKRFLKQNKIVQQQSFKLPMSLIIFGWIISSLCFMAEILAKQWNPGHDFDV